MPNISHNLPQEVTIDLGEGFDAATAYRYDGSSRYEVHHGEGVICKLPESDVAAASSAAQRGDFKEARKIVLNLGKDI